VTEQHVPIAPAAPIALTAGEPAGIGPDLCLAIAADPANRELLSQLLIIADPELMRERAKLLAIDMPIECIDADSAPGADVVNVLPVPLAKPVSCGSPDPANAASLLDGLRLAVDGCLDGRFSALVTAPLHKGIINDSGVSFSGHTEFLAELCGVETPVMLLVADQLRVALASTHLPLRDVPDYLTSGRIEDVLAVIDKDLRTKFGIASPRVVVCGLNPHAGEGGHLGHEDQAVILPAITAARAAGIDAVGPVPADTAFTNAAGHSDAVLAMYHDQGLPVIKYAGFGNAVNLTLGLPIIRTSVDHGTAFDLAGTGNADSGSLLAALRLARSLATNAG